MFSLSVLLAVLAAYNIRKLAKDSEAILKDNYNSVIYTKDMLKALENFSVGHIDSFNHPLKLEESNITEKGEQELVDSVEVLFHQLVINPGSDKLKTELSRLLYKVMEVNLDAIKQKDSQAQQTAAAVFSYLIVGSSVFFVLALVFMIRFPSYIAVPVIKRDLDKTNFIATISHQLKTPIASIKLSTKLLEDIHAGGLNDEQKQLIANIKNDIDLVLKISGEVLSMAQVEAGKLQLNIQTTVPKQIIEYAIEATHFQAEQKQIHLQVNCEESLPKVNADAEKTAWVMTNLISNAIRYSPEKSVILIEALWKNNAVEFSVEDKGQGIDPQYHDKIFERYFRVPGSKVGTGLGLSISKDFIEAQGGQLKVESEPGKGSKFSFTLMENFLEDFLL